MLNSAFCVLTKKQGEVRIFVVFQLSQQQTKKDSEPLVRKCKYLPELVQLMRPLKAIKFSA
jgi:hypothetical protein